MHNNVRTHNPLKRLASLLFALLMVFSTFSTAYASDSFYISGIVPAGTDGFAFVRVTDLNDKISGATLTVDGVPARAAIMEDIVPTTYWFVIDVSKVPFTSEYNLPTIEAAAQALTSLPAGEKDNVRIVWVADSAEITSTMSMADARTLINIDVAMRFNSHKKTSSALYDGISAAVNGALEDSDRFHRIYIVTDGRNVTSLNSLTTAINNAYPVPISALLLTNSISTTASSHFTSGHNILKSFVAANHGVTYTLDMRKDVAVNTAALTEQANAAVLMFQSHIENSLTIAVDLTSIYDELNLRSKTQTIEIASGSTSDSRTANLNLGVVPAPTPSVTATPTAKVTATPTISPTPTPKPDFKALKHGQQDAGTDTFIADMQMRLKGLGFMSDSYVPGKFDDATAKALQDFAKENGITLKTASGKAIEVLELRQLFDSSAKRKSTPTPEPTGTPTPTPTATPEFVDLILGNEDMGDATYVTRMQAYLAELGFFADSYTPGLYDDATAKALKAFCERAGLKVDSDGSAVSVRTLQILSASNVTPSPTPSPTPTPTPTPKPTEVPDRIDLEYGMVDDPNYPFISTMQDRLYELGYITAETIYTYGTYDDGTAGALNQFCIENNQPAEEYGYKASVALLRYLYGPLSRPHVTPTPTPSPTPTQAPTPAPEFITLVIGDTDVGDAHYVMNMQAKLASLGYYTESYTPGVYDNATANALRAFCATAGFNANSDGTTASAQILTFLSNSNVTPTPVPTGTPTPTPEPTSTPVPEVMGLVYGHVDTEAYTHAFNMQSRLKELGYLTDASVTYGTYDDATANALRQFCTENNISPVENGYEAPLSMLRLLFAESAKPHAIVTPTPAPAFIDLELGASDAEGTDYVAKMQQRLKDLGYFDGIYNSGLYEQSTADALSLFCQQGGYDNTALGTSVTASFLQTVLFNGNAKVRTVVEPPLSDKLIGALTGNITLFGFELPMWAIVAVCAVLLIVIVVLIIVVTHRGKSHHNTMLTGSMGAPASSVASSADLSSLHDGMTVAGSDDEMTVADGGSPFGSGVSVQLDIQYNGRTVSNSRYTVNGTLTIGRGRTASGMDCDVKTDPSDKSVSRHHCTLIEADGRLKLRNESSTARGTILNNMPLTGAGGASEEAMTVADDSGSGEEYLNSGDVIQIGNHYITVNY